VNSRFARVFLLLPSSRHCLPLVLILHCIWDCPVGAICCPDHSNSLPEHGEHDFERQRESSCSLADRDTLADEGRTGFAHGKGQRCGLFCRHLRAGEAPLLSLSCYSFGCQAGSTQWDGVRSLGAEALALRALPGPEPAGEELHEACDEGGPQGPVLPFVSWRLEKG
jgi:hypothetical protein